MRTLRNAVLAGVLLGVIAGVAEIGIHHHSLLYRVATSVPMYVVISVTFYWVFEVRRRKL